MVAFLCSVRPIPYSLTNFANQRLKLSLSKFPVSVPTNGFSSHYLLKHSFQSSLHSVPVQSTCSSLVKSSGEQSEIIFVGTGTSEGIPRVSCLTDPVKNCLVCKKAVEPGSKNRRLNTSILIRYNGSSGIHNVLIDAGKFFYHSALRWFPTYGSTSTQEFGRLIGKVGTHHKKIR